MQLKEYFQELYEYNYWANKRYLAVAESLTEEQLFRKQGHSWDSVHAVLVHMMSSERMWPQRWRGEKGSFLDPQDFPTVDIRARVLGGCGEEHACLHRRTDRRIPSTCGDIHESQGRDVHPAPLADDGPAAEPQHAPPRRAGGDVCLDEYSASRRRKSCNTF